MQYGDFTIKISGLSEEENNKANRDIWEMIIVFESFADRELRKKQQIQRLFAYLEMLRSYRDMDEDVNADDNVESDIHEEINYLTRLKEKIYKWLEDERDWERKINQEVENIQKNHPLLFPIIIFILSTFIGGLITDYTWEGINQDKVTVYKSTEDTGTVEIEMNEEDINLVPDEEHSDYYKVVIYNDDTANVAGYIKTEDIKNFLGSMDQQE